MVSPMRPIASQPGGATAGPAVCTLMALVCRRRWNAIPRSVRGVARIDTCRDPASRLSRTINPALTHRSRFSMLATRTIAAKLPIHPPARRNGIRPRLPRCRRPILRWSTCRRKMPWFLPLPPPQCHYWRILAGMSGDREATADRDPVTAAAGRDHAQPGDVAGRAGVLPDALTALRRQVGAACHRLERPSIVHRIRQRHRRQDVRRIEDARTSPCTAHREPPSPLKPRAARG